MRSVLTSWVCVAALVWAGPVGAQEQNGEPIEIEEFWLNSARLKAGSAAQIVGVGDQPFLALSLRALGLQKIVWDEIGFGNLTVPELKATDLTQIRDGQWLPTLETNRVDKIPPAELAFYRAYNDALVNSFETSIDVFKTAAEENRNITYGQMMGGNSARYRGKVVPIKGRMVRLRREEPTHAAAAKGVKSVYVGWVFGPTKYSNPFCVQFPILPRGLEPGEKMDEEVTFFGYFLANFKYEGAKDRDDKPRILTTPLLVGPTVIVEPKPAAPAKADVPMALVILGLAVSFLIFLSFAFFLMYYWFQRGDRQVFSSLHDIKLKHMQSMFQDEPAPGTPENPVSSQLIANGPPPPTLPEARPVDSESKRDGV